ncbi:MAG: tRNA-dihydrouridine synthase [Phycisphaeraceae bacterium]|nr:tRNA-dihydrouridine synthase [Phycisphaeraceae bacterium]
MIRSGKNSCPPKRPAAYRWVDRTPFYQAGLAGYSDEAMRMVARKHGCPFCVTEAMLDHFLIHGGKGLKAAELSDGDHPIAGQLMGSHPTEIARGARILVGLGYDVVDINLACPVKKIKKKCRGGHLLSVPDEAIDILKSVADAVGSDVPMQVKMRRAYDDSPEAEASFFKIFDAAIELGYAAVTVHGRTVEQKYNGPSRWPFLTGLTDRYRSEIDRGFLIFGSGDVFSAEAIFRMIEQTGVCGASVARGCIGNPWIFREAKRRLAGEPVAPPTLEEQRQVLLEHFQLSVACHGEKLAGRMMRKFGIKFSYHHPDPEAVKSRFIAVKTLEDWHDVLESFYTCKMSSLSADALRSNRPAGAMG